MRDTYNYHPSTERVCPTEDCPIGHRFHGLGILRCPYCARRLVVACSKCDSGAVDKVDGLPLCFDCLPEGDR